MQQSSDPMAVYNAKCTYDLWNEDFINEYFIPALWKAVFNPRCSESDRIKVWNEQLYRVQPILAHIERRLP